MSVLWVSLQVLRVLYLGARLGGWGQSLCVWWWGVVKLVNLASERESVPAAAVRWLPALSLHNRHPPPQNCTSNFPQCFSKTEREEAVVTGDKCFSKSSCPKPSALENTSGAKCALLIKGENTDKLHPLDKNLRAHFGHTAVLFSCYLCKTFNLAERKLCFFF